MIYRYESLQTSGSIRGFFHTCALYSENGADVLKDSKFWSGVKTTKLDMLALRRTFEQTQTNMSTRKEP